MAYAAVVTLDPLLIDGRSVLVYRIAETEVAPGDECSVVLPGRFGEVLLLQSELTAGSATTIRPELGVGAAWTVGDVDHVAQAAVADTSHRLESHRVVASDDDPPRLYLRSQPDAGADNSVTTLLIVAAGVR